MLGAIPLPAAIANLSAEGHLAAGFRLRQWWPALWKNKLGYFITWTILFGLFFILYLVFFLAYATFILCWLIPFLMAPMGFYLGLVYAALFGQTFREGLENQAAAAPVAPPAETGVPAEPAVPDQTKTPADPAGAAGEVPQA
jgi:hypothetical protein